MTALTLSFKLAIASCFLILGVIFCIILGWLLRRDHHDAARLSAREVRR